MKKEELIKIEYLCNIKVEEEKRDLMTNQINSILNNIKKIYEIEIGERLYRPVKITIEDLRDDIVKEFEKRSTLFDSSRKSKENFLIVPRILGGNDD